MTINEKKISDTTLLNFMFNHRVSVRCFRSGDNPNFRAEAAGDWVFGATPRDALRGLYIVRRKDDDDSE